MSLRAIISFYNLTEISSYKPLQPRWLEHARVKRSILLLGKVRCDLSFGTSQGQGVPYECRKVELGFF